MFGPTRLVGADGQIHSPGHHAARRILAHLALGQPATVPVDELIESAWGHRPPRGARSTLRMAVSRLRTKLAEDESIPTIVRAEGGYRLTRRVTVDVHLFERAVIEARSLPETRRVIEQLDEALGLWTGVPYADAERVLFVAARQALSELRLEAIRRVQLAAINLGVPELAGDHLLAALADHPLNDELVGLQMRTLFAEGDQQGALQLFQRHRQELVEQHGLRPSQELERLELQILRRELPTRGRRSAARGVGWVVGLSVAQTPDVAPGATPPGDGRRTHLGRSAIERAEVSAALGHWDDAAAWYEVAVDDALADGDPDLAADHCLRFAHVVWDPLLGERVASVLGDLRDRIDSEVVAARVELCLAGGLFRTGYEAQCVDVDRLRRAQGVLDRHGSNKAKAWGLTHLRDSMTGLVSTRESLALTEQILALGVDDPLLQGQTRRAAFVDLVRLGRTAAAGRMLRSMGRLTGSRPGPTPSASLAANAFGVRAAWNCWDLAMGRWDRAQAGLGELLTFKGRLGDATVDDVVLAQSFWLCRELGDVGQMRDHREGALTLASENPLVPHWRVAAALLASDIGERDVAASEISKLAAEFDLSSLPPGSHRSGILALLAETLASAAAAGVDIDRRFAVMLVDALRDQATPGVMLGWPAVIVGPRSRFIGLAAFAAGQPEIAESETTAAVRSDRWMPAMRRRSLLAAAQVRGERGHPQQEAADRLGHRLRPPLS